MQNNIEKSQDIIYEKSFRKDYKVKTKISAIFVLGIWLQFLLKNHYLTALRKKNPK